MDLPYLLGLHIPQQMPWSSLFSDSPVSVVQVTNMENPLHGSVWPENAVECSDYDQKSSGKEDNIIYITVNTIINH